MKRTIIIFIKLLLLVTITDINSQNINTTIRIEFPYFYPYDAYILGSFTGWAETLMTKESDSVYQIDVGQIAINSDQQFNAKYKVHPYYTDSNVWISTSFRNLSRILYVKVYINDQQINSYYVWGDHNIHFYIDNDSIVKPSSNPIGQNVDERIPPEVHWPYGYISDTTSDVPDSTWTQVTGWVQVLHDNNYDDTSFIEVDYLKLCARINEQDILLDSTEYESFHQVNDGGLYLRYPFFPTGFDEHDPMPATVANGNLIFYPSGVRNKVWHFWNTKCPRAATHPDYTSYWFEVKYRIIGKACIQIGIDYRDAQDTTNEAGVSDWGFDTEGEWQIIRFDTRNPLVNIEREAMPLSFNLEQNYPNPFNPITVITYSTPPRPSPYQGEGDFVSLKIYNILGQEIVTLVNEYQPPGIYKVNFDGRNLSSGVYIYRLQAGDFVTSKKMVLIK